MLPGGSRFKGLKVTAVNGDKISVTQANSEPLTLNVKSTTAIYTLVASSATRIAKGSQIMANGLGLRRGDTFYERDHHPRLLKWIRPEANPAAWCTRSNGGVQADLVPIAPFRHGSRRLRLRTGRGEWRWRAVCGAGRPGGRDDRRRDPLQQARRSRATSSRTSRPRSRPGTRRARVPTPRRRPGSCATGSASGIGPAHDVVHRGARDVGAAPRPRPRRHGRRAVVHVHVHRARAFVRDRGAHPVLRHRTRHARPRSRATSRSCSATIPSEPSCRSTTRVSAATWPASKRRSRGRRRRDRRGQRARPLRDVPRPAARQVSAASRRLSFHETKNFICGEGGALIVNDPRDVEPRVDRSTTRARTGGRSCSARSTSTRGRTSGRRSG